MKTEGTPKDLSEVTGNIMWEIMSCPLDKLTERLSLKVQGHIRDYLAQKFTGAVFMATPDARKAIGRLWFELTGETNLLGEDND